MKNSANPALQVQRCNKDFSWTGLFAQLTYHQSQQFQKYKGRPCHNKEKDLTGTIKSKNANKC